MKNISMKIAEHLDSWIPRDDFRRFGEILLGRCAESGAYQARHYRNKDASIEELEELKTVAEVREMARFCGEGNYRPLKTAPTLRDGWLIREDDGGFFHEKLDAVYPASFATTVRYLAGEVDPTPLRTTLGRQSGRNRDAKNVTDHEANRIMRETCAVGCLRVIAWPIDESCPVSRLTQHGNRIPLICAEACTFVVSAAQEIGQENEED